MNKSEIIFDLDGDSGSGTVGFDGSNGIKSALDTVLIKYKNMLTERRSTPTSTSSIYSDLADVYNLDTITYWLKFEKRISSRPDPRYMLKQKDITFRMRRMLVDWLVEVGLRHEIQLKTLFMAVNFIDRFLSKMSVRRGQLQLVGTASLFVAAKFEEVLKPKVSDYVEITDSTYNKVEVIKMETVLLQTLKYDLTVPTVYDFVLAFSTTLQLEAKIICLAIYFSELSLLDGERYFQYFPSTIAAASLALSRYTFNGIFWDDNLSQLSQTNLIEVQRCSQHLFNSYYRAPTRSHNAVFEKYKSIRYCSIALTLLPKNLPWVL